MTVLLQLLGVAAVPLNVTVLVPWVAPKFAPFSVTTVPTTPEPGEKVLMIGALLTVNNAPLLDNPTVTVTFPVVVPEGTGTTIFVSLQLVGVAILLGLKLIVLVPWVAPKSVPVMVTDVPITPAVGDKVIAGVTPKTAEFTTPPTVTSRFWLPDGTPLGTIVVMLVLLQALGVAATPPKVTVLEPWVAPKLVPLMVTVVPSGPVPGDDEIAATTVSGTPLLATFNAVITTTLPVPVPKFGIEKVILVVLQLAGVSPRPPQRNELAPCVAPKFAPVTVTVAGTGPVPTGTQFDESA
jgi:hypothetical protein